MDWLDVDSSKGFKRIQLTRAKFPRFVDLIFDLVSPLTEAYYYDDKNPMNVVIGLGNNSPMHQDVKSGGGVYQGSLDKDKIGIFVQNGKQYNYPPHGFRMLIDLGSFEETHNSRQFVIQEKKDNGEFVNRLVTDNRLIAMDAGAAGYSRTTPFHHGRFGDGITVQIDFSTALNRPPGKLNSITPGNVLNYTLRNSK